MLQKVLKIVFILLILASFCISYVYATDINLNLPSTGNDPLSTNPTVNPDGSSTPDDTGTSNIQDLLNNLEGNDSQEQNNLVDDDPMSDIGSSGTETIQPSGVSNAPESGLGITNIINILLITVGVILILLAIAIIIRVKG